MFFTAYVLCVDLRLFKLKTDGQTTKTENLTAKGQVALEEKTVYLCQESVITMKNQVRPVCSPKDKIWL